MNRKWRYGIIFIFSFYFTRFLFILAVFNEEKLIYSFETPKMITGITEDKDEIKLLSQRAEEISKKVGAFYFYFVRSHPHPEIRIKWKDRNLPFMISPYTGPLYLYIPKILMTIFGENIYSLRIVCFITFAIFVFLYTKLFDNKDWILFVLLFITFPLLGMRFISLIFWGNGVVFIAEVILFNRILKILKEGSFSGMDFIFISLLGGIMLHFHLFAGGAILIATLCSLIICVIKNKIRVHINLYSLICGLIILLGMERGFW